MDVTRRELLGTMPAAMAGAWALTGHGLSAASKAARAARASCRPGWACSSTPCAIS